MATAPQIAYFDGSGFTTSLTITTNLTNLIFHGTVDPSVIDVQISINGNGFVSDPTLVGLNIPDFTIPNLLSFPQGLNLDRGLNIIQIRAIDIMGGISPISTISVTVVAPADFNTVLAPPTGVRMLRKSKTVQVSWAKFGFDQITGYNVYGSTGAGGSGSGYLQINANIIPIGSQLTSVEELTTLDDVDFDIQGPSNSDFLLAAQVVDGNDSKLIQEIGVNRYPLLTSPDFNLHFTFSTKTVNLFYSFEHDRNATVADGILNNDTFLLVANEDPLFYVVTAVLFDPTTGSFQESAFSQELSGSPLPLDTTVRGLRIRDQSTVAQNFIQQVQVAAPTLSIIPGSTAREVHIEPFSNEIQKAYFLMDFVSRSKSFLALLQIDDPSLTGTSIPVANSQYKQALKTALGINSDVAVQSLIDGSFDSLAENFATPREGRRAATVTQTFYITTKPTKDYVVQQGAIVSASSSNTAPNFRVTGTVTLTASNAQSFYNPNTRRYEITAQMVAVAPGTSGNLPALTLDTVVSGANGFSTINEVSSDFGRDSQSNLALAESAMQALVSVDTGTEGGYKKTANGTPGVIQSLIVKAGDPAMQRDYDPIRMKHIGGKVDVYIKGTLERTIIETFAFEFNVANNIRFDVIDPINLVFRARDSRLSPNNPIFAMLFNPSQGLGLRNHSILPTANYDLTGVTILNYNTIQLSTIVPQPVTSLDDFVEGDYRFRSNSQFTASLQPIVRVVSVVGEVSGALDSVSGYTLYKLQDPLIDGDSTIATDYVQINQIGNIPSGNSIQVNNETHILIGQIIEPLNSVGINSFTLIVYSSDRSITYNGPGSLSPDYIVIAGSQTMPLKIERTTSSAIPNGATVSVDYQHDENFAVTYIINDILQQVQTRVNTQKHATADVLVKQAIENPLSTEATIQLLPNTDQPTVDSNIRTSITILTDNKGIGGSMHQSDESTAMENVQGVDFVVQPFAKFTLADGALRVRDQVPSDYVFLQSLSAFVNAVYILTQSLPFNTTDGGGPPTIHHGVYMDDIIMTPATSLANVSAALNSAWIIGANGAIIVGYSDDATLAPLFVTSTAIQTERLRRTANKVVVSLNFGLTPPDVPTNHAFSATYVVNGDRGPKDITTTGIEFITPGDLTISYRAATKKVTIGV